MPTTVALRPSSLEHHGRAAPGACDLSPEAPPLKPQLLTQIPELMVRLLDVTQGLAWAVVMATLEKFTFLPFGFRIPQTKLASACDKDRSHTGRSPGLWVSEKVVRGELVAAPAHRHLFFSALVLDTCHPKS